MSVCITLNIVYNHLVPDKYKATWISYSRIRDFQTCPRAFYLNYIYRQPENNHKIQLMTPALALGQVVHQVLESLSKLPTKERFKISLIKKFNQLWPQVSGKKGGFATEVEELRYKQRGEAMLRRVMKNPGPLAHLAVKISQDLPWYWLSEEDELILSGKIDWLEYLPDQDAVHIIDFKTSKQNREASESLQLPIYHLLVNHVQHRKVAKISYWYLEMDEVPLEQKLPNIEQAQAEVLAVAKKIKTATKLGVFKCPRGEAGCRACRPLEKIVRGEAEFVGRGQYGKDIFILPTINREKIDLSKNSKLL